MNSNTKKSLEAILVGGVLVVSLNAHAQNAQQQVCSTGGGTALTAGGTSFVKTVFTPKCSANSVVTVVDDGASFGVRGASTKGNQIYGGSTEGGGVTMCTTFGTWNGVGTATSSAGC
jgi:hypothetical protein